LPSSGSRHIPDDACLIHTPSCTPTPHCGVARAYIQSIDAVKK
jgi:hypothetical protein